VELRELVRTLQGMGKTIIISSHILPELAEMCTDIAIIQGGKLTAAGSVDTVIHQIGGGHQLEIRILEPEQVEEAITLLKNVKGIDNVTREENNLIQADFNGDDQALNHILVDLISHNIPIVSFAPRSGSGRLEEVFMSITEGNSPS
jgi:ABC-2 type transport system ATP-binding protein